MQLSHAFSLFSVCSCDFWPSIAWTCTCTPRVSKGAPSDAVYVRGDTVRALEQPTACLADQYGANTGPVEPTYMDHAQLSGPKIVGSPSLKAVHAHRSATGYTGPYGSKKSSNNRTIPQRGQPTSLIRVYAMRLIGKQGQKASSYEQRSLIKLSWAHMPFRFCGAQVHISFVAYFRNNSLLACVETTRIKTSCFEAVSNKNGNKNNIFTHGGSLGL